MRLTLICPQQAAAGQRQEACRGQLLEKLKTSDTVFFGLRHNLWVRGPIFGKRTV